MKKENKLNNRGFTLIEVLAVIVILVIIVAIAIPNISASLDRQTCKTTENKAKLIESAAQFYVSDNRNAVRDKLDGKGRCKIDTDTLLNDGTKKYITKEDLIDGNNEEFYGYIVYDSSDETYTFCFDSTKDSNCQLNDKKKKETSSGIEEICDPDYTENDCY